MNTETTTTVSGYTKLIQHAARDGKIWNLLKEYAKSQPANAAQVRNTIDHFAAYAFTASELQQAAAEVARQSSRGLDKLAIYTRETAADNGVDFATAARMLLDEIPTVVRDTGLPEGTIRSWVRDTQLGY